MKKILVSIISLLIIITLFNTSVNAEAPTIVKGYVYVNDVIKEPDEVHLTFPSQSRIGTVYSDGRYIIVFTGENVGSVGEFYIIYNDKSYIPTETVTILENQTVYEIDLYIETADGGEEQTDETDDKTNIQPKAKAGGPYYEVVGENIYFDASESYDSDGNIENYEWDFGDDINAEGKSAIHSYQFVGNYRVTLTVTDDKGKSDLDITYAYVTETQNDPPAQPVLNGALNGSVNTLYKYTIFSTDVENDSIQYVFDWGDQTNITSSDFQVNGTSFNAGHSWSYPGIYTLTAYAIDENSVVSKSIEIDVLIDSIYCGKIGYMVDYTSDGFFDLFYSNVTGEESIVVQVGDLYLIDEDNDGEFDYEYNFETNNLALYSSVKTESEKSIIIFGDFTFLFPYVILVLAFALVLIILIFKIFRKPKKEKEKVQVKPAIEKVKEEKEKPKKILDKGKNIEDEIDKFLANEK